MGARPISKCQLVRAEDSVTLPANFLLKGLSRYISYFRRKHQSQCANAPSVLLRSPEQRETHPVMPRLWSTKQVVEYEYTRHGAGGEAWVQQSKPDCGGIHKSEKHYRLVMPKPIEQKSSRPLGLAWLAIELTICIEQWHDNVQVGDYSLPDLKSMTVHTCIS